MIAELFMGALLMVAEPEALPSCPPGSVSLIQSGADTYDPAAMMGSLVRLLVQPNTGGQDCRVEASELRPRNGTGQIVFKRGDAQLRLRPISSSAYAYVGRDRVQLAARTLDQGGHVGAANLDLFEIEPGQFVPAGDYRAELHWVDATRTVQPLEMTVRVEPALRLIGDEVRRVPLGDVTQGAEARSRFFYITNADLRVTVNSHNNGQLVHEMGQGFGSIPYVAYLGDQPLSITAAEALVLPYQRSSVQSSELRVIVAAQNGLFAGRYRDVLTLSFIAY